MSKLHLVHDNGNTPEPICTLSPDEQAHLLDLADVALQNNRNDDRPIASNRAQQKNEHLIQEFKDRVERSEEKRSESNRNDAL
jgi:hypothetical protein